MKNKNEHNNKTTETTKTARANGPRLVLPLMKTPADARQLCELEQDNFYMVAFFIQVWWSETTNQIAAEYAGNKDARKRPLQSGQAIRALDKAFGTVLRKGRDDGKGRDEALPRPLLNTGRRSAIVPTSETLTPPDLDEQNCRTLFQYIQRFAAFEHPVADPIRKILFAFATESGLNPEAAMRPPFLMPLSFGDPRLAIIYLCEWMDSVLHLQAHKLWHYAPVLFDTDPTLRAMATIGFIHRHFRHLDPKVHDMWYEATADAAKLFNDEAKARKIHEGYTSNKMRPWTYEEVDTAIITLWPLVKRHNWTYADLLKTIRPKLKRPEAYPCDSERTFATHCTNVLGLRKTSKGHTSKSEPTGAGVARRLLGLNK